MIITNQINMAMDEPNVVPVIHAIQCDSCSRAVAVTLTAADVPWEPPAEAVVSVAFKKPDGKRGWYDKLPDGSDACSVSGNMVTAILAPEMLTAVGRVEALIVFQDADLNQLSTSGFVVNVEKNPAAGVAISNDYYAYSTMADVSQAMEDFFAEAEADRAAFQEQAEKAYADIREEIAKVDGSSAIVCEASGDVIAVSDASNRLVQGLKVYGKTTQVTTSGKNLLDISRLEKGTFSQQTGEKTDGVGLQERTAYYVIVQAGQKLINSNTKAYNARAFWFDGNGAYIGTEILEFNTPVTVPDGAGRAYFVSSAEGFTADGLNPQIELGSTPTAYEPYTGGIPSPNPDYPQELVSVGDSGSIGMTAAGKNLLENKATNNTVNGLTYTVNNDGSMTLNGTPTANTLITIGYMYGVIPGESYTISGCPKATDGSYRLYFAQHNAGGAISGTNTIDTGSGATAEILSECTYLWVGLHVASGTVLNGITFYPMVRFASVTDDTYEPYKGQSLTFSTPNGLPGIPVTSGGNYTDESGQKWICDEIDYGRGVYVQRVQTQEIKSNSWAMVGTVDAGNWKFGLNIGKKSVNGAVISKCFPKMPSVTWGHANGGGINIWENGYLEIVSPKHTTAEEFKEWGWNNPIVVMYALAEPIETPIPEEELAAYRAIHTNKPNTTVFNDAGAHMELEYVADTKLYIDNKFAELSAAIVSNT